MVVACVVDTPHELKVKNEQSGFHYTCKTCTYIPSPWSSKPMDECDSNQQCESGTVESLPDGWTNGAPQQVVAGHDEL